MDFFGEPQRGSRVHKQFVSTSRRFHVDTSYFFFFFLMLPLNKLICCSKGWTSLPSFFLSPRTRYIYREVPLFPAALSSSKSLVQAVSIASSLMRFISCFFASSDRPPPSFWCPRRISAFIWLYLSTSENQAKLLLGDLIVSQRGWNTVCDCVELWQGKDPNLVMFPNFGYKLPTNEPSAGSEQPTGNRSGL